MSSLLRLQEDSIMSSSDPCPFPEDYAECAYNYYENAMRADAAAGAAGSWKALQ